MKVLLLGEFSGYFTNLKKGLSELGVDCDLAADGDGWKKIDGFNDIRLFGNVKSNSRIAKFYNRILYPIIHVRELYNYDVVYIVSTTIFHPLICKWMFKHVKKHSKKTYVSVSGSNCSVFRSYVNGDLSYYVFDDNPEYCKAFDYRLKKNHKRDEQEKYIYTHVDGIIPIMYEYAVGVRKYSTCKKTIPIPFDAKNIEYKPNIVREKIVIMHGVIKEKCKGTDIILKALEIVKEKHSDEVEIIVDGKMPLKDYLEKLKTVNILVDQCKEHCYGLNALYAMAEGRIVLGGASQKSLAELNLKSSPVIHIEPNVDMIVEQLEYLISQKDNFEKMGFQSRKFVEEYHNCKVIAKQYLDLWT